MAPYVDLGNLLDVALETEFGFGGSEPVVVDYPYAFLIGKANQAAVLCSEPSVPLSHNSSGAIALVNEWLAHFSENIRDMGSSKEVLPTAFASVRFSAASQHHMATSYGGARAYIEAPILQPDGYKPGSRPLVEQNLIERLTQRLLGLPNARLHFGLMNEDSGWDAAMIKDRFADTYGQFLAFEKKYDPQDITFSE